jgi:ATP-dependent RNA helicase DeaD
MATPVTFESFNLPAELLRAIHDVGFEEPTPIQAMTIPLMLASNDVMAQAQTGTGKTAAFAIPILSLLHAPVGRPRALVLVPTRELAMQVAEAIHRLGRNQDFGVLAIYGGQPIERQLRGLRHGVDIVVGTPGRIMDHMRRESLKLDGIQVLILDEADEMLDMGFIEDIEYIINALPKERATGLFSATLPSRVTDLARRHMRDPQRISIEDETVTVPATTQTYFEIPDSLKADALCRILDYERPTSALIFCRTKAEVDDLTEHLLAQGYEVESLHGDMNQSQRDRVMRRYRDGLAEVLVATDVAARGLDIEHISHVINYDIPWDPETYVHRIGRTGRAGRTGMAITLVAPRDRRLLRIIEHVIGRRLDRKRLPSPADIAVRKRQRFVDTIRQALDGDDLDPYLLVVEELADEHDPVEIAAAAIKLLLGADQASAKPLQEEMLAPVSEAGMVRLFVGAGRKQRLRPADLVGAIANEAGLPGKSVGSIDIFDDASYVEVPETHAESVISALSSAKLRGRRVAVRRA